MPEPTVFKPAVTRPLPDGAELFVREGRQWARWIDSQGQTQNGPTTVADKGPHAGETRLLIQSDRYVLRYEDEAGVLRTVNTDLRTEEEARRLLDEFLEQVREAKAGRGLAPARGAPAGKPEALRDHFRRYVIHLKSHDTPAVRIADIERQVRRLARQCGFARLTDICGEAVQQWLTDRANDGMPAVARNAHLDDLMDFVEWCLHERLLPDNPLKAVKREIVDGQAAPAARPLSEDELNRLLRIALGRPLAEYGRAVTAEHAVSDSSAVRFTPLTIQTVDELAALGERQFRDNPKQLDRLHRQGWQRALIYKTLALLGLRRSELVSLKIGMLQIKGRTPLLILGSGATREEIPLREDLAADLKLWLRHRWRASRRTVRGREDRTALRKAFVAKPLFKLPAGLAKLLAIDLQAAGIAEMDPSGARVDVHAAREVREVLVHRKGTPLARIWAPLCEKSRGSGTRQPRRKHD